MYTPDEAFDVLCESYGMEMSVYWMSEDDYIDSKYRCLCDKSESEW